MTLHLGDCLDVLKTLPNNSIDSCVTDPPYGFSFMGKKWDYDLPSIDIWREVYRVLKPGAHLLAFGGPRTYHRLACGIEDAGFEIRDQIQWLFGSGFPKSLDVSKAIDKMYGAEREVVGPDPYAANHPNPSGVSHGQLYGDDSRNRNLTAPATPDAIKWQGWGTALKPANEPICLARKPLSESTVAKNVLKWGTGGLNIDGCRVDYKNDADKQSAMPGSTPTTSNKGKNAVVGGGIRPIHDLKSGRFPANLIFSHSEYCSDDQCDIECAIKHLDEQSGVLKNGGQNKTSKKGFQDFYVGGAVQTKKEVNASSFAGDSGGASRFFYCAKVSSRERNQGCEGLEEKQNRVIGRKHQRCIECGCERISSDGLICGHKNYEWVNNSDEIGINNHGGKTKNSHPTVKPIKLMSYLCRLVTPPAGVILDPFMGSGSTGMAALQEGFKFIGIEREKEYFEIAERRVAASNRPTD